MSNRDIGPPSRRERIGEQRRAAQAAAGEDQMVTFLAGLGAVTVLIAAWLAITMMPIVGGYLVMNALEAYGIHAGGVKAPAILIAIVLVVITFSVAAGTRIATKNMPEKFAEEIRKAVRNG